MNITIYGLIDPRFPTEIRYVGQTATPIFRHKQHCGIMTLKSSKERWVDSIRQQGVMPQMVTLELVKPEQANEREAWHCEQYKDLTNDKYGAHRRFKYREPRPRNGALAKARAKMDYLKFTQALASSDGKIAPAARLLGISRPAFYDRMAQLGIERQTAPVNQPTPATLKGLPLIDALTQSNWNFSNAAKLLGVSRPTIYSRAAKLGIKRP